MTYLGGLTEEQSNEYFRVQDVFKDSNVEETSGEGVV